jgi:hypothetical protein
MEDLVNDGMKIDEPVQPKRKNAIMKIPVPGPFVIDSMKILSSRINSLHRSLKSRPEKQIAGIGHLFCRQERDPFPYLFRY